MKIRTNEQWLHELRAQGREQREALDDLRSYLLRAALYSLHRHRQQIERIDRSRLEQVAEDAAQDALVAILQHLEEFRSESKFTTWAYKFAINAALVTARHEHWKNISLDEIMNEAPSAFFHSDDPDPSQASLQTEAWSAIREVIACQLTERQRQALQAIVFEEVPLDEVARRWNSNRNATYKLLHDARRKLKSELEARGYELGDLLNLIGESG